MTSKNDQKVAIAYPHPSEVNARWHRSMLHLFQYDAVGGKDAAGKKHGGRGRITMGGAHIPVTSSAVVARARNRIVKEFLEVNESGTPIDWLFMIDTDMVFSPDIVDRLVEAAHPEQRPIVGGLCFSYMADLSMKFWPTLYAWIPGTERLRRLTTYPPDTVIPVGATGAACLLVHRTVLQAMKEKFPPPRRWFNETPFYEKDDDGEILWETGDEYSEDISFCLRAQSLGFPVHVHTGIRVGHVKDFEINEDMYLAEQQAIQAACVPALPTYVVIASKNRPIELAALRQQLRTQCTDVLLYDNGYDVAPPGSHRAHSLGLHEMWNQGIFLANKLAKGQPHNVVIMNDDVEVETQLLAKLEAALRSHEDHWLAYPDDRGILNVAGGALPFGRTEGSGMAGQTITGWCFMMRGEANLRFDERFKWWYGDSDLERQVREAGKFPVVVNAGARHFHPNESTFNDPEKLAMALADEHTFADKWGLDVDELYLHQNGYA
jgi:GT2 family glycosyltransferase